MPFSIGRAKLHLGALSVLGAWATIGLAYQNGTIELLKSEASTFWVNTIEQGNTQTHGAWTGHSAVDSLLDSIVCFFWPMLDGSRPATTLQALHLLGQSMTIWMLLYVEALRVGNHWRLVSFITIFGLLMENVAYGAIIPLYCFVHLCSSPTVTANSQTLAIQKRSLLVHPSALAILPWSIGLGAGIPTLMMLLSSPEKDASFFRARSTWIILRMAHPVWTFLCHLGLSILIPPAATAPPGEKRERQVLVALQRFYTLASSLAVVSHVGVIVAVLVPRVSSQFFSREYQSTLTLANVFRPPSVWSTSRVSSVGEGVAIFLKWDELVAVVSILVWALSLNLHGLMGKVASRSPGTILLTSLRMTLLGGPAAAAVSAIMQRDKIILEETDGVSKKIT